MLLINALSGIGNPALQQAMAASKGKDMSTELANLGKSSDLGSLGAPVKPSETSGAQSAPYTSFTDFLNNGVKAVDGKMKAAEVEQTKVMTGETNNLHQSMIAMQEAGVSFSLMVEVRNKLVDSYQELMRMQM